MEKANTHQAIHILFCKGGNYGFTHGHSNRGLQDSDSYKELYPDIWSNHYGEKQKQQRMKRPIFRLLKTALNPRERVATRLPDKNILIVSILRLQPVTALMAEGIFIKLYTTATKTGGITRGKNGDTEAKLATNELLITIFSPQKRKKGQISFRITQKTIIFALSKTIVE